MKHQAQNNCQLESYRKILKKNTWLLSVILKVVVSSIVFITGPASSTGFTRNRRPSWFFLPVLGSVFWKKFDKMHPWELKCVFMSQTIIFILCNWINNFYFVMVWPRLNPNLYLFQFLECSGFQNCGVIYCINDYAKKISEIDLENDNLMAKPTYHANYIHKRITCCNNVFTYVSRT